MKARISLFAAILLITCLARSGHAGDLTPPARAFSGGQPIAIMKSIDEVEPRVIISGLPLVITNSGSYYLSKNLHGTNGVGIQIECDDVQLDLNGFALIGGANTQDGILVVGTNENINIRNGSIREWEGFGINAPGASDGSVVDIKANRNYLGGIVYGESALIEGCSTYGNGYHAPLPPGFDSGDPNASTDGDELPDNWEMQIVNYSTVDSITSVWEVLAWYDGAKPTNWFDFDMDGAYNGDEYHNGTDPTDPNDGGFNTFVDMDGDMMDDNWESNMIVSASLVDDVNDIYDVWEYFDPVKTSMPPWDIFPDHTIFFDFDNDGASNREEFEAGTDPNNINDFPAAAGTGGDGTYTNYAYTNYTAPDDMPIYGDYEDPMDEPSDDGIRVGALSTVTKCKSRGNRGSGIYARFASRIIACISAGNKTDGIRASGYCTIRDCTAARNRLDGIVVVSHCRVQENNCSQNGDYERVNTAMPVGAGIRIFGSGNRIEDNNVSGNALGIEVDPAMTGMGLTAGRNLIIGNSSVDNWGKAFDLGADDYMGGAADSQSYGDPGSTTNATMDASNPFSNFSM